MYESPIDIILTPINTIVEEVRDELDGYITKEILTATRGVSVNVNTDELIKALNYDRNQYEKGYADATASIIHCRDCKHYEYGFCNKAGLCVDKSPNGFCDWGER